MQAGANFEWQQGSAILNPSHIADFDMLWQRISTSGLHPTGMLCLPGFNKSGSAYETVTQLLQTAGESRRALKKFEFITTALERVCGEPVENPDDGDLSALARTIPLELPGSECRSIDLEPHAQSAQVVTHLLEELSTCGAGLSVALRRGTRWQKTWSHAPLKPSAASPFRDAGVYIITGGAGGIGHVLAKHLLSQHRAHVVILGRSALPHRSEWRAWIADHGDDDPTSRRIRRIEDLESAGGEILYLAADVADRQAMRSAIEQTEKRFGSLNGVIHTAGIFGGSRILFQTVEEARKVRQPKIEGSRVLADLLRGRSIDFLLFCSSISSHFPAPTESAYASANAFQNSFAEYCRSTLNIPAVSIAFDAWREVGMVADAVVDESLQSYIDYLKHRAMDNREGIEVIQRILGQWRGPQILTSTSEIEALTSLTSLREDAPLWDVPGQTPSSDSGELATVIEIWKDLLGVGAVSPSDNFFNLGGHSLMGTMMIARIREQLGVALSMRDVFEAQTPARLADLIAGKNTPSAETEVPIVEQEEREIFEI